MVRCYFGAELDPFLAQKNTSPGRRDSLRMKRAVGLWNGQTMNRVLGSFAANCRAHCSNSKGRRTAPAIRAEPRRRAAALYRASDGIKRNLTAVIARRPSRFFCTLDTFL